MMGMTGRYAVDVAGLATTTQMTSARLDELAQVVNGCLGQVDALSSIIAPEGIVSSAFESATIPRRRSGLASVARGGEVIATAQQAALEYTRADIEMEATTAGASSGLASSLGRAVP